MNFNMEVYKFENYDFENISNFQQKKFYLKKIPLFAGMFFKRKITRQNIRTKKFVDKSYNQSAWKTMLQTKAWEKSNSLYDYYYEINENQSTERDDFKNIILMNNKLQKISPKDLTKAKIELLTGFIKKYVENNDEIIEIGCGPGSNLFGLSLHNIQNKMHGYDISINSITTAQEINKRFNSNIKFDVLDMTEKLSSVNLKNKVVFSNQAFEQIKYDTANVINDLINSGVSQVMHFEPLSELYGINFRDVCSSFYIKARDYQDNLLKTLKNFEDKGRLKILQNIRLGYGANPVHELSFTRWMPTN